jgi:uncharacterized phiE125 gp8 family phage protein
MDLVLTHQDVNEPVTLQQAKDFCAVHHDLHDELILALIESARDRAETFCNRSFVQKDYRLYVKAPAPGAFVKLYRAPVRDIIGVWYRDNNQELHELPGQYYTLQAGLTPPFLMFSMDMPPLNATNISIMYQAGYDQEWVPAPVPEPEPEPEEIEGEQPLAEPPSQLLQAPLFPFPAAVRTAILIMVRTMYDFRADYVAGASVAQLPMTSQALLKPYRIMN